jgi:copper chaperone CopZ
MLKKQKGAREMRDTKKEKTTEKARIVVSVSEINCAVCAMAIQKQVMKISGVKSVKPAIMLNKVFIDYDPKLVDSSTIRKAINKTGFKSYMTVEENQ